MRYSFTGNNVIVTFLIAAFVCLTGCGAKPPEKISTLKEIVQLAATVDTSLPLVQQAYSIASEKLCKKHSGQWERIGKQQKESCVLPASDAGKSCQSSSDCEVACVALNEPVAPGTATAGVCLESTNLFGCRTYVSGGTAEPTLCVD
jgi:hypothetical protein